jgi:hypothetical protein
LPTTEAVLPGTAATTPLRLPPESAILLLCSAAGDFHPAQEDRLTRLLDGPVDWPRLLHLALRERAATVLWRRLGELGSDDIDEAAAQTLRQLAMVDGFRQQYLEDALAGALRLLHGEGCTIMLLKGAALGVAAYPAFRDRPMGDVDLLLPEGQLQHAFSLLRASGWVPEAPAAHHGFYEGHHHLTPLQDPRYPDAVLELHRHLLQAWSPFVVPLETLWAGARPCRWHGAEVYVPSMDQLLLHLCVHFMWLHTAERGAWRTFSDVHALAARGPDWAAFCAAARSARAVTCCYWTLRLAAQYAAVPVPGDVLDELRPPGSDRWLGQLERHLVANALPGEGACPSLGVRRRMWEAAIMPGWSGHGPVRPWDEAPRVPIEARPILQRVQAHVRSLSAWRHYVRVILGR